MCTGCCEWFETIVYEELERTQTEKIPMVQEIPMEHLPLP